ncbi:MAG TPA: type II CAAX endopeptidase family protein [Candidatus Angelobacter sp.]|nr:type II CAAX endopeptidase family protein [Candidatus Angelobacter sp.]
MRSPSLLKFFLLTYAVTWTVFIVVGAITAHAAAAGRPPAGLLALMVLPGVFAPAIVAIALTAWAEGRDGVAALLRPLFRWRVGFGWYVFAIGFMAAIKLTVALVLRVATGSWPRFGQEAWYIMLAATIFSTVVGGQAGEEIGWRGYALPGLAARFGLGRASVLLGVIWATWHLPLFFIPGADLLGQSFAVYLLQVTALSVVFAWLYWRTQGSLLLTMLLHAAINNTKDVVPSAVQNATHPFTLSASRVAWLTVGLLWIAAAYFLMKMPRGRGIPPTMAEAARLASSAP